MKLFLREVTNIMFVYIALISRKINIFLNIQSEENVTHVRLSAQPEPLSLTYYSDSNYT